MAGQMWPKALDFKAHILKAFILVEDLVGWHPVGPDGVATPDLFPSICPIEAPGLAINHTPQQVVWSHKPVCKGYVADPASKYCVYTDTQYGPNGISIIAKQRVMDASILECVANNRTILPKTAQAHFSRSNSPQPYEVVDIEGKGKGLVATRPIAAHEVILTDEATLIMDKNIQRWMTQPDGYTLLNASMAQLPSPAVIADLHRLPTARGNLVFDTLNANSLTIKLRMPNMAVLPRIARINHDCRPNAYMRLPTDGLSGTVVAGEQGIAQGEEITISYLPVELARERRRRNLEKDWGFECGCKLCTAPEEDVASSDANRKRLHELETKSQYASYDNKTEEAIQLTEESLEVLREEDLMITAKWRYMWLAMLYEKLGREDEKHKYEQMVDEWKEKWLGDDVDWEIRA
ncbi:Histone-lysine N-methyltransferase ASHR2 [Colletotrichum viniferum]|nr:Histone-lysine N-methyltransferase ASHR2 [Colletotrichum viniferum]